MVDDDDIEVEEEEEEGYQPPEPIGIADGELVIFDHFEFAELTNSIACHVCNGQIWVVDRDTFKLRDLETLKDVPKVRTLSSVKKP